MKIVTFNPMSAMLEGFDIAANAVGGTLGPRGRNVFIDDALAPKITNDGATIAQNIVLSDKIKNAGVGIVKNTSGQTNDDAGDGTTTTAVILQSIVHECLKRPENPMLIEDSLKKASLKVISELKKKSTPITLEKIKDITDISAEDEEISNTVSTILKKIGKDAVVTVEDSNDSNTSYEIVDGYEAHLGFMSPVFINDTKRARAVMNDVPVFVTEKKISTIQDIAPLFEKLKANGINSMVIVCDDIETPMLGIFAASKATGAFNSIVIRATGDILKDIEATVGATRVSDTTGLSFAMVDVKKHLGFVKKVVSDANKTLFIPQDTASATMWANHLQKTYDLEHNLYIKERLNKRISQLRGGIAIMRVGSHTDFDREFKKLKAEDAIKAAKAALEEGIVEGGGMALWRIADKMKPKTIGEEILKKALTSPLRKIIENAGKDYAEIVKDLPEGMGYDAKEDTYADLFKMGIIDPTKVERCAVENSVSNAAKFITTFATITDEPAKSN